MGRGGLLRAPSLLELSMLLLLTFINAYPLIHTGGVARIYTGAILCFMKEKKRKAIFVDEETHKNIGAKAAEEHRTLAAQLKHDYQKRRRYSQVELQNLPVNQSPSN